MWNLKQQKKKKIIKWTKYWTDTLPKKIYRYQVSIIKDTKKKKAVPHHLLSENCMVKYWDTTSHLLEWPKSRTVATPNTSKDVEQQNSHSLLAGMQNGIATLKGSLTVCYRARLSC